MGSLRYFEYIFFFFERSRKNYERRRRQKFFSTYYLESHEYLKVDGDQATVGITDFAQNALGDVVYVELPEVGDSFEAGDSFGSVESVKAASDVYLPVEGEIVEVNELLDDNPGLLNEDCMGEGWFVKIKMEDPDAVKELMDQSAYDAHLETLEE